MKTETKELENCQVSLAVTLDAAEAKAVVREVEREFEREVQLPGFRKGKVPLALIRKEFGDQMKRQTMGVAVHKYYDAAVKEAKVDAVTIVNVKDFSCTEEAGAFTAIIDVKPTFKLPTYKGLKIAEGNAKVSQSDVEAQLERMRISYAKYEDAKDGDVVGEGDFIQIDYSGMVDGKPISEIAPDAKVVASGTGFWTQVEDGRFLKEILDAVRGMKVGDTKEGIKATFDKESAPEGLKGAKAVYTVTLKAFRRRILPDDASFAASTKFESYEKLVADVRDNMEKQAIAAESARRENEAVELLLKKVDFAVPGSQVDHQIDVYLNDLYQRAQYAGLSGEYFEQNKDKILKDARENATRQVRLWYIIDAIAEAEKIEAKDEEKGRKVLEFVLANAKK